MSQTHSDSNSNKDIDIISPARLDALTLPFTGTRLIEASAGTGKTYTISGLYLRLILGIGVDSPLSCEQILVVTFTNAATAELRDRIRARVHSAFKAFMGLEVNDAFIEQLYDQTSIDERPICLRRLDLALKSLDEAAIFTIHGFCQRILADLAFESSLLFESEFTLDDSEFLHHAVRDFWREHCYPLPEHIAGLIQKDINDPEALSKQLRALLGASLAIANPKPMAFDTLIKRLTQSLNRFQLLWPQAREALEVMLHALPLNGARFGKQTDNYPKLVTMLLDIDNWVASPVRLPPMKVLLHLSLSTLKLNKKHPIPTPSDAPLLAHIEQLYQLFNELVPAFLYQARQGIALRFIQQKTERNLMTPDDLLLTLAEALSAPHMTFGAHRSDVHESKANETSQDTSGSTLDAAQGHQAHITLAKHIATRFPIALIDEFQDTDPLQFTIFSQIYQQASTDHSLGLLMIGDPKQAIYAFRGADIHTYIQARQHTPHHYSLDTNYRSSKRMVDGVNRLFSHRDDAFMSQSIPFEAVKAADKEGKKSVIEISDTPICSSALRIQILGEEPEKGLNKVTARITLADAAAEEIARLLNLGQQAQCLIEQRALIAKDIAILVRDKNEAAIIKKALRERQIGAVFLSRDSVYDTLEAREVAILLNAMALPKNEQALRSAMATQLLGFNCEQIQQFNQDEDVRQDLLEQFFQLHQLWTLRGIMPALLFLAKETRLIERLLASHDGERRLTDFRHLAELLQQKSTELDGCNALLNWYQQALIDNTQAEESQLRLESEQNLVQIVTIHKSKGLEYPICFLPFVSLPRSSRKPSTLLYHKDGQLIWDLLQTDEGFEAYKQETLAEDLRLLYVALTRPVYRCYLSIANQSRFTKKEGLKSQLHETAIGYLLGFKDTKCEFVDLKFAVESLTCDAISVHEIEDSLPSTPFMNTTAFSQTALAPKRLKRASFTPWRVGSYSGLVKNAGHEKVLPGADDEGFSEITIIDEEETRQPDRFSFEKGANAGSFMHLVLELIDFTQAQTDLDIHLPQAMSQYGIDESWHNMLKIWYLDLLSAPLNQDGSLSLALLTPQAKLVEMEFYLPIETLNANQLNALLSEYGYSAQLRFDELKGMLKGFIDLTFEYQGQFYIADYKSNHLGHQFEHYHQDAMSQAIISHQYDLQYIIYTLALHRYLTLRLPQYDFDTHMGGSYYLFLRGMSGDHPLSGVFYDKPPKALILALDALFDGKGPKTTVQTPPTPIQQALL